MSSWTETVMKSGNLRGSGTALGSNQREGRRARARSSGTVPGAPTLCRMDTHGNTLGDRHASREKPANHCERNGHGTSHRLARFVRMKTTQWLARDVRAPVPNRRRVAMFRRQLLARACVLALLIASPAHAQAPSAPLR